MITEISRDYRISISLHLNDPDQIAQNLISIIRDQLDSRAPLRRIQTSDRKTNISKETRSLLDQRNSTWKEQCQFPSTKNLREYKSLKNRVKKSMTKDKLEQDRRSVEDATTSRDQWKGAKKIIGWTTYGGPKIIIKNGKPITSP